MKTVQHNTDVKTKLETISPYIEKDVYYELCPYKG